MRSTTLGGSTYNRGHLEPADAELAEAVEIYRAAGDRYGEAMALDSVGLLRHRQGQLAQAQQELRGMLALRVAGRPLRRGGGRWEILAMCRDAGEPERAHDYGRSAAEILDELAAPEAETMLARL